MFFFFLNNYSLMEHIPTPELELLTGAGPGSELQLRYELQYNLGYQLLELR